MCVAKRVAEGFDRVFGCTEVQKDCFTVWFVNQDLRHEPFSIVLRGCERAIWYPAAKDRNRIYLAERIRYNPPVPDPAQQPLSARPRDKHQWRYYRKQHQLAAPKPHRGRYSG